jgi:hypothetical protein
MQHNTLARIIRRNSLPFLAILFCLCSFCAFRSGSGQYFFRKEPISATPDTARVKKQTPVKKAGTKKKAVKKKKTAVQVYDPDYWKNHHCIRGEPAPTLTGQNPNIVFKDFKLNGTSGIERAVMYSGDSLIIENSGCEVFTLTYTLKSSTITATPSDMPFWFNKVSDLLLALQDSDVPLDFKNASAVIKTLSGKSGIAKAKEYSLNNDTGNMSEKFQLLATGKLKKGAYMKFRLTTKPI